MFFLYKRATLICHRATLICHAVPVFTMSLIAAACVIPRFHLGDGFVFAQIVDQLFALRPNMLVEGSSRRRGCIRGLFYLNGTTERCWSAEIGATSYLVIHGFGVSGKVDSLPFQPNCQGGERIEKGS